MKRRQALVTAVGFSIGLAGCSEPESRDGGLDLTIFNQTESAYTVEVGLFEDSAADESGRAYSTTLEVEPDGQEAREAVVESGRYLVRYHAYEDNSRLTDQDHVHFIPSGDGTESLTFDIRETGELTRR